MNRLLNKKELQAVNKARTKELEQWRAKNKLEYQRVRTVQSKENSIEDFISKKAYKIDGSMPFIFWIYVLFALIYISTWFFK